MFNTNILLGKVYISGKSLNRLSAVIGRYIRPPKTAATGNPASTSASAAGNASQKRGSWQVDSSSWEFLGLEKEEEEEEEGEEAEKHESSDNPPASSSTSTATSTTTSVSSSASSRQAVAPTEDEVRYENLKSAAACNAEDSGVDQVFCPFSDSETCSLPKRILP